MEEKKIFRHAIHIVQLIRREKIYLIKYTRVSLFLQKFQKKKKLVLNKLAYEQKKFLFNLDYNSVAKRKENENINPFYIQVQRIESFNYEYKELPPNFQ